MQKISELFPNYYRIIVFESNNRKSTALKISNKTRFDSKSNTVGILDDASGKIEAHLLYDDMTIFQQPIDLQNLNEATMSPKNGSIKCLVNVKKCA